MRLSTSIFLIALGAAFKFAVDLPNDNLDVGALGVILMLVGVVGLCIWRSSWEPWNRFAGLRPGRTAPLEDEPRPFYREPRVVSRPAVEPAPSPEPVRRPRLVIYDDVRGRPPVYDEIRPDDV